MGSQKKEAILQAKWAVNFVKKAKWAKNELLSFWIAVQPCSAAAESLFNSTVLYSSAAVIFGLPGTLLCCKTLFSFPTRVYTEKTDVVEMGFCPSS